MKINKLKLKLENYKNEEAEELNKIDLINGENFCGTYNIFKVFKLHKNKIKFNGTINCNLNQVIYF